MKIAYVVKRYPRYSETFIVNEILAHERAGLEIEIFALLPPEDSHFQNQLAAVRAPVTYLKRDVWKASYFWSRLQEALRDAEGGFAALAHAQGMELRDVAQGLELALLVRERAITHIHSHFATASTAVARIASILSAVPYTFTAHAKDIFHRDIDREELREKFRRAAASITVSDFNVSMLRREFGGDARHLRRVYNGLDLAQFRYARPALRSRLIVAVGRLVEKKGFDDLIDACALLRERGVPFDCQIVGSGEMEAVLRDRIASRALSDCVELVGPRPQSEVVQRLRRAAVFAAPCKVGSDGNRDGLPTVLLEAMALGTPCISTPVTGIPEAVVDGRTGLLVGESDVSALADALGRMLDDSDLRNRSSIEARQHIEEKFDIDKNAGEIRDLFRAVEASMNATRLEATA